MLPIPQYIVSAINYYESLYKLYEKCFFIHYFEKIMDIIFKYLFENKLEQI